MIGTQVARVSPVAMAGRADRLAVAGRGVLSPRRYGIGWGGVRFLLRPAGEGRRPEVRMSTVTAPTSVPTRAPAWAVAMRRVINFMVNDFGGGPRPWKFAWVINLQKSGTFPVLAFLIAWYHNTSTAAWIYLAMHVSYGLVWIIKDLALPDPAWQHRITIGGGINAFLGVLGWYWVFGWLLISGPSQPAYPLPDYAWSALCISLCLLGCVVMIAADDQKYFTLRLKRGLITDGMFRYVR